MAFDYQVPWPFVTWVRQVEVGAGANGGFMDGKTGPNNPHPKLLLSAQQATPPIVELRLGVVFAELII